MTLNWLCQLPEGQRKKFAEVSTLLAEARSKLEDLNDEIRALWEKDEATLALQNQVEEMMNEVEILESTIEDELAKDPICMYGVMKRQDKVYCPNPGKPSADTCPKTCPGRRDRYD